MKQKTRFLTVGVITLFIGIIIFFRPLSFSDVVSENYQINIVLNELEVRNGEAYIASADYEAITEEQTDALLALLKKHSYRRTFGTLISDGSLSRLGNKTIFIYIYDDISLVSSVFVSSSGDVAVNGKSYHMRNAESLIEQIIEILEQSDESDLLGYSMKQEIKFEIGGVENQILS